MPYPLISIIIPVYNVERYLRACLDSIVNQRTNKYEVILIDDGSTDGSQKICDEYANRYTQVNVIHKKNEGVSSARNVGLDVAKGEWIWFVDADDYVSDSSLLVLSATCQCDCDTIFHGLNRVFEDGTLIAITAYHDEDFKLCKDDFLSSHICYQNGMLLFSSKIIRENSLRYSRDIKMGEDLEFQYKYLLHCAKIAAIPYNFYYIRERKDSASRSSASTRNDFLGSRCVLLNMMSYLENMSYRGNAWLGGRLAERLKCYLRTAATLPDIDLQQLQSDVRRFVRSYRSLGYKEFENTMFRIAVIDVRLSLMLYRMRLQFTGKNEGSVKDS